jgi:hypothetical protein
MKKVWAVEDGCYSDYRVVGVFSTKKNALVIAHALELDNDSVHEWSIDPALKELNKGYWQYQVLMLSNGKTEMVDRRHGKLYDVMLPKPFVWERSKAPLYKDTGVPDVLDATVWARNNKHAVKIANEIRTRMIARGEWK